MRNPPGFLLPHLEQIIAWTKEGKADKEIALLLSSAERPISKKIIEDFRRTNNIRPGRSYRAAYDPPSRSGEYRVSTAAPEADVSRWERRAEMRESDELFAICMRGRKHEAIQPPESDGGCVHLSRLDSMAGLQSSSADCDRW